MSILIEQYISVPWQSLTYYAQAGTDADSNVLMHPVVGGFMIPDPANLTALARPRNDSKPPEVGHYIKIFPDDWFEIRAVDPAAHCDYRLTLAPFSG